MISIAALSLGLALMSSASATPWPKAEAAVAASCPQAEQEDLIACADRLVSRSDEVIKRQLCRSSPKSCQREFASFDEKRKRAVERRLDAEGSVSSQMEAAWFALERTLSFERDIAERQKRP